MAARNQAKENDDFVEEKVKQVQQRKYEGAILDTPFLHIFLDPLLPFLRPVMSAVFAIRWQLSRPLNIRLFPSFFPFLDIPLLRAIPYITIGQVLLASPVVALFTVGYIAAFVSPNLDNSGYYTSYALYAIFLTANKTNSVFAFLFGIPFERMIPYHNLVSLLTVTLAFFHGYVAYAHGDVHGRRELHGSDEDHRSLSGEITYAGFGATPNLGKFLFDGLHNMSGSLLIITLLVLVSTSVFPIFRQKMFDLWLCIHILAAFCVVIFAVMHDVTSILMIAAWWGVDVLTRYLVMATCRYPREARLELITDDVVKVSFQKPSNFSYNAGQFVQIAFLDIGLLEFHPISISSAPHESEVTLHIKASGGWSNMLIELAKEKKEVRALIEGPYGSLSVDVEAERYQMVLLACGGIGITPCSSIAKSLIHANQMGSRQLEKLQFVWAVRDLDLAEAICPFPTSTDLEVSKHSYRGRSDEIEVQRGERDQSKQVVKSTIFLTKPSKNTPAVLSDGRKVIVGRPDLYQIVSEMKEYAMQRNVTHIAVFGCGPKALIDDLKNACRQQSQGLAECQGVTFDVHEEIFHF